MDIATTTTSLNMDDLRNVGDLFSIVGDTMREHKGRSVVRVQVNGKTHFLKRFWFAASQVFKGHVRRGFHELRMIDWLNTSGFAGPKVVRRGWSGVPPFCLRMYFLMEEIHGELPLEAAWSKYSEQRDAMLHALALNAARLHDAGFTHTDFSERHILVGLEHSAKSCSGIPLPSPLSKGGNRGVRRYTKTQSAINYEAWTFRLIDLERASVGRVSDVRVADDLATLSASVMNESLRENLNTRFLDTYAALRKSWPSNFPVRALVERGKPTKSF